MKHSRLAVPLFTSLLYLFTLSPKALSQAYSTASKSQEISVFGAFMGGNPDFGPRSFVGVSAGADYTFFPPRWRVAPSLEVRGTELLAPQITEKTVQFGPRFQLDLHDRYHPYVDALYGGTEVLFHPYTQFHVIGYTGDRGSDLAFGGGINIDLAYHLAAKFDVQGHAMKFSGSVLTPDQAFTLSPIDVSAGINYTIPFRTRNRREDFR